MILITGATGHFENSTIDFLLEKGARLGTIAALVKDRKDAVDLLLKGIIVRIGDADHYASLVDAFERVDKLLLVSVADTENHRKRQENVIKAAKEAGVKHIFYTSCGRQNKTQSSPVTFLAPVRSGVEKMIKESGIPYTIFGSEVHTDMLAFYLGQNVSNAGGAFPLVKAQAAGTLRSYMAEVTAQLLMSEGHEYKEYDLSGTETFLGKNAGI